MGRFSFPRAARLRRERDFKRVYRQGRRLRIFPLRFTVLRRPDAQSRLGLAVSRKVGRPALINRWKRAIREAFRLNRHRLEVGYDIVVSVDWDAPPGRFGRVPEAFDELIERLNRAPEAGGSDESS